MSKPRIKKYRLYAMPTTDANIELCASERFLRITADYLLVYKQGRRVSEKAVEVTEKDLPRLTAADERWLFDCNLALLGEEVQRRSPEIINSLAQKVEALETALRSTQTESGVSENGNGD